jgi:hypothetical protein
MKTVKFLLLAVVTIATGCAPGQKINLLGEYQFQPNTKDFAPATRIHVRDSRTEVVSGSSSSSNVGIMRSIAGVPWAIHTASGMPIAADFEKSIVLTLHKHGWQNAYSSIDNPGRENALVHLTFDIKQWNLEVWFDTKLSYCVELSARSCKSPNDSNASQCGQRSLNESEGLDKAVGEIVGNLLNSPQIKTLLDEAAKTPLTCTQKSSA